MGKRWLLHFLALLLLSPFCLADGSNGNDFWQRLPSVPSGLQSQPEFVYFNVDARAGETIAAGYSQFDKYYLCGGQCKSGCPLDPPLKQPNNTLGDNDGDSPHFWIQFVPPWETENEGYVGSGQTVKQLCPASPCSKNFTVPTGESGAWQVRLGAGVLQALCHKLTGDATWVWGIKGWDIKVNSNNGRVWNDKWYLVTASSGSFTRDFFVLAGTLENSLSCKTEIFDGTTGCKGELFKLHFADSTGQHFTIVSNSRGITYNYDYGGESGTKYLKESVPLQRNTPITETCIDNLLAPDRYTVDNILIEPEHRIYWRTPQIFSKAASPSITKALDFDYSHSGVGGNFSFTSNSLAYFELVLELDGDDDFDPYTPCPDSADKIFTGTANAGSPTAVAWNGKDKCGNQIVPGNYKARLKIFNATAHFPLEDFEGGSLRIQKYNGTSYSPTQAFWYDSIAGGTVELEGAAAHIWSSCKSTVGSLPINPQTNCFPMGFTPAQCASAGASGTCCPADKTAPRLDLTVGDIDMINTWVYGDFVEPPDFPLNVFSLASVKSINAKTEYKTNESVEGTVTILNGEAGRELKISFYNAATGALISSSTEPLATSPSQDIPFGFGLQNKGNYRIVAQITSTPCNPCRREALFPITEVLEQTTVPEINNVFALAVACCALIILLSNKRK